jgi:DNA-binding response OmpR family regulator
MGRVDDEDRVARLEWGKAKPMSEVERFGNVVVDRLGRRVFKSGREVALSPRAFDLLTALLDHEGRVMSRQQLLRDVWGYHSAVATRTVDVHVSIIRRAIERDPHNPRHVVTVQKHGYRFDS